MPTLNPNGDLYVLAKGVYSIENFNCSTHNVLAGILSQNYNGGR